MPSFACLLVINLPKIDNLKGLIKLFERLQKYYRHRNRGDPLLLKKENKLLEIRILKTYDFLNSIIGANFINILIAPKSLREDD